MKKSKKSSKIAESTIFNPDFEPIPMPTVSVSKTHHIKANLEHILSQRKAKKNGAFGEKVEKLKKSFFDNFFSVLKLSIFSQKRQLFWTFFPAQNILKVRLYPIGIRN